MKIKRKAEQDLFPLQGWNPVLLLNNAIAVLSSTRLDEISNESQYSYICIGLLPMYVKHFS